MNSATAKRRPYPFSTGTYSFKKNLALPEPSPLGLPAAPKALKQPRGTAAHSRSSQPPPSPAADATPQNQSAASSSSSAAQDPLAGVRCTVTDTFEPEEKMELYVRKGDVVLWLHKHINGWVKVHNVCTQKEGFVPEWCVAVPETPQSQDAARSAASGKRPDAQAKKSATKKATMGDRVRSLRDASVAHNPGHWKAAAGRAPGTLPEKNRTKPGAAQERAPLPRRGPRSKVTPEGASKFSAAQRVNFSESQSYYSYSDAELEVVPGSRKRRRSRSRASSSSRSRGGRDKRCKRAVAPMDRACWAPELRRISGSVGQHVDSVTLHYAGGRKEVKEAQEGLGGWDKVEHVVKPNDFLIAVEQKYFGQFLGNQITFKFLSGDVFEVKGDTSRKKGVEWQGYEAKDGEAIVGLRWEDTKLIGIRTSQIRKAVADSSTWARR
mmetsp:Transcript_52943/g.123972  ORF Transcript_52943/g.123972 Transcript_52943/m.123972 type:complete len:437 (+) Transcript_52943:54-1364(+)